MFEGELWEHRGKAEGAGFAVDGAEPGGTKCGNSSWGKSVLAGLESTLFLWVLLWACVKSLPLAKNMTKEVT